MKTILILLVAIILITGCEKTAETKASLDGTYTGTFERTVGMGGTQSANVSITFDANKFSGTSDKAKFPAICNGTYTLNEVEINFKNGCVWTADFDWSLILTNDYSYSVTGDSLQITRVYPGQMTDVYRLKKEQK